MADGAFARRQPALRGATFSVPDDLYGMARKMPECGAKVVMKPLTHQLFCIGVLLLAVVGLVTVAPARKSNASTFESRVINGARVVVTTDLNTTTSRASLLPQAGSPPSLVISQVYGAGGTPGATYQNSFVELFNRGTAFVDLNQWSVRITSDTGQFNTSITFVSSRSIPIAPGQYILIGLGSGGSSGSPVPADFGGIPIALGSAGKIALTRPGTTNFSGTCPLSDSGLADLVGFGSTANCFEGPGPTPNLSNTAAAVRKSNGCVDTDNNSDDFQLASPTPRNSSSPNNSCTGSFVFSNSNYFVSESANFLTITVNRIGNNASPATVKYNTSDATGVDFNCNPNTTGQAKGSASRKCDYHIAAGRLRFAAGESSKQIILSLVNDVYFQEGSEALTVTLSNPTGAILGFPNVATVSISDDDFDFNPQPNPIDKTPFFVRMLYVDLLSREPDPAGQQGWIDRIDLCGQPGQPPPPCDRVTVGGDGFLRSAEFFDREFFVIRLYRTALGRILTYNDVADLAYVSGFLTDADLELSKQELVAEIMSRSEFGNMYNSLTNAQYVDTMINTAAVTLPVGVRDGWVNGLDGSTKTRAEVFRELSERSEVTAKYLNEARVVSCYYGFFTRNPDGAYFNFLQRLDSGEITLGDLANAFINASEYRQRFGP
jgi:Lamin Tail Domain/Calx-beta domain